MRLRPSPVVIEAPTVVSRAATVGAPMKLVVTGTGRCGTGYCAVVLTAAGLSCGHERRYTYHGPNLSNSWGHAADASWMAVPYLSEIRDDGTPIVVVYRHPAQVIGSFLARQFFTGGGAYRRFMYLLWPHIAAAGSVFDQACEWYVTANTEALRHADLVTSIDTPDFAAMLDLADVPSADVDDVLRSVGNVNAGRSHPPLPTIPQHVHDVHDRLIAASKKESS